MGGGTYDRKDWDAFTTRSTAGKSTAEVFSSTSIKAVLDPKSIKLRESRDSADNPISNAIITALDVTGSMGRIVDNMARVQLKTLFEEIHARKPVIGPQLMFMGIGDALYDRAPLQVSQFESDMRIGEQLINLWLEKGGGGNACESYQLPLLFAATRTSIDCFEKRGQKGFLFTVGDEKPPAVLTAAEIRKTFGDDAEARDYTTQELLDMAERSYHVFHVIVDEGEYARSNPGGVDAAWRDLLGQRALHLKDHTKLAEVIVSAIQITQGDLTPDEVASTWTGDTSLVVASAVRDLTAARSPAGSGLTTY